MHILETTVVSKATQVEYTLKVKGDILNVPFAEQEVYLYLPTKEGEPNPGHGIAAYVSREKISFEFLWGNVSLCMFSGDPRAFRPVDGLLRLARKACPRELDDFMFVAATEVHELITGTSQFFLRFADKIRKEV